MTLRVALRADASAAIGIGHVARCLALGRALRGLGAQVALVARDGGVDTDALVRPAGVEAISLPRGQASAADDALQTTAALRSWRADAVVVDHYGLDASWHRVLRQALGVHLAVIDDLADRALDAELLIDHNLADHRAKYAARWPAARPLLGGPRFALLGPQYAEAPRHAPRPTAQSIGIFMGGADAAGASLLALTACRLHAGFDGPIEIAVTMAHPHLPALREACARWPQTTLLLEAPELSAFFARHDLQIGAGGGATWERCCIGAPTLALLVADNQRASLQPLAALGAVAVLDPIDELRPEAIGRGVAALLADAPRRAQLAAAGRRLVDGRGAQRVALALLATTLAARDATLDDAANLHAWRNDPATREVSHSSAPIAWDQHLSWLQRTLADPSRRLLLGCIGELPVGVVRFDRQADDSHAVSIYLDPQCVGLGLGPPLLKAAHATLPDGSRVVAEVVAGNERSRRLFESCGYRAEGGPLRFVTVIGSGSNSR